MAIDYCKERGLEFDAINEDVPATLKWKPKTPKPFAHIYIDDRNLPFPDDGVEHGEIENLIGAVRELVAYDKTAFGVTK